MQPFSNYSVIRIETRVKMEQPNTDDIHSLVKKCLQGNHKA